MPSNWIKIEKRCKGKKEKEKERKNPKWYEGPFESHTTDLNSNNEQK